MKPHEIARLKRESKQNGGNSSDIDLSDFDMDNVDDLLAMTETNTSTENTTSNHELPPTGKSSRHKNTDMLETNNNKNKSKSSSSSSKKKSQIVLEPDDFVLDVGMDSESPKKLRFNSTSSDKIWSTKTSNEETYKSLLSNLETTLQSIDTLVVGPSSSSSTMEMSASSSSGKRKSKMMESTTQRTQPVHIVRVDKESVHQTGSTNITSVGRKSKANKGGNNKQSAKGPQMIRTEKCTVSSMEGGRKKSKSVVTRTQTTTIDVMPKSVGIVDDYDIISPALQPPKQISCSPLHIKQEQDSQHAMMKSQNHQQSLSNSVAHNRTQSSSNPRHINDVYDAHLLLEASGLRNALDEILRSPLKSDKLGGGSRQRFTSESSTQFLAEQSEEEQHLIKIEPTSPDLREIVNGVSSVTASEVVGSAGMELNVRTSQPRRSNKASRSQRSSNSNRKYFEFSSEPHHLSETKAASSSSSSSDKRLSSSNQMSLVSSTTKSSKSARTEAAKPTKSSSSSVVQNPTSFLDYAIVDSFNAVTSSSPTHHNANSFASISAVVSAADASAAAAQQNPSPNRKPQRYFECEMCSAVFSDRAQLLDHVPIHI